MRVYPETLPVLRLISDGAAHPAATIRHVLGLSPVELKRALDQLRALGVAFGAGVDTIRLAEPMVMLDPDRIGSLARDTHSLPRLQVQDVCGSTNDMLRDAAARGAPSGTALTCELQSNGRGRLGRAWVAPLGGSIALSVLWRFPMALPALGGLSLAAGVAVVDALEARGAHGVKLKWPNDLLLADAKVGGILIETLGSASTAIESVAIIGVGLNLRLGAGDRAAVTQSAGTPSRIPPQAIGDLSALLGRTPDRDALVVQVAAALCKACAAFAREGFAAFRGEWLARHAHHEKVISVWSGNGSVARGTAVDVALDGALVIEADAILHKLYAGEVSVRT